LFASGLLDIAGIVDTVDGKGVLMYVPGGLWELIIFPAWLFIKGFKTTLPAIVLLLVYSLWAGPQ